MNEEILKKFQYLTKEQLLKQIILQKWFSHVTIDSEIEEEASQETTRYLLEKEWDYLWQNIWNRLLIFPYKQWLLIDVCEILSRHFKSLDEAKHHQEMYGQHFQFKNESQKQSNDSLLQQQQQQDEWFMLLQAHPGFISKQHLLKHFQFIISSLLTDKNLSLVSSDLQQSQLSVQFIQEMLGSLTIDWIAYLDRDALMIDLIQNFLSRFVYSEDSEYMRPRRNARRMTRPPSLQKIQKPTTSAFSWPLFIIQFFFQWFFHLLSSFYFQIFHSHLIREEEDLDLQMTTFLLQDLFPYHLKYPLRFGFYFYILRPIFIGYQNGMERLWDSFWFEPNSLDGMKRSEYFTLKLLEVFEYILESSQTPSQPETPISPEQLAKEWEKTEAMVFYVLQSGSYFTIILESPLSWFLNEQDIKLLSQRLVDAVKTGTRRRRLFVDLLESFFIRMLHTPDE